MGTADIDRGQGISICQFILSDTQIINSLLSSTNIYITSEPVSGWTTFYGICCFLAFEIRFYGFEFSNRIPTSLLQNGLVRTRDWVRLPLPQSLRLNVYVVKTQGNKNWGRSQCSRFLRRGSARAGLLGLRVRIPPRGIDVCPLWVLCVVRWDSLRRTHYPSTGIVPADVELGLIVKSQQWRVPCSELAVAKWGGG